MRLRSLLRSLALWGPVLGLSAGGLWRLWLGDDGFINIRIAQQLLAGNGFVYNAGERVEAGTSPLWVLLITALGALGIRLEDAAVGLGLLLSAVGLWLVSRAALDPRASERTVGEDEVVLPFGALAYAALPAAWDYASSGLENSLTMAWFGASLLSITRAVTKPTRNRLWWAAGWLGLAPLIRPDAVLLGLFLGMLLLYVARSKALSCLLIAALPGSAFQIFRMGYFAMLTPNTALAKEAFEARWEQGIHYLWNTVGVYWLLVPLSCVLLALVLSWLGSRADPPASTIGSRPEQDSRRLSTAVRWAAFFGGVLHLVYVVRVGGDFMHARLLLPGLFATLAAVPVLRIKTDETRSIALGSGLAAVLVIWAVVCASSLRVPEANEHGIGDERGWHARMARMSRPYRIEHYGHFFFHSSGVAQRRKIERHCDAGSLDDAATPKCRRMLYLNKGYGQVQGRQEELELAADAAPSSVVAVVASQPLGIVGMVYGLHVNLADAYGLAEPVAARLELSARGRPGHEKHLPAPWFAARYAAPSATPDARVTVARQALACGGLRALSNALRAPMTFALFWQNLKQSLQFQRLRVPLEPAAARSRFCS